MTQKSPRAAALAAATLLTPFVALADTGHPHAAHLDGAVISAENTALTPALDILAAHAHANGNQVTFHLTTAGTAGAHTPTPAGALNGAPVFAYVWPTSLDPSTVGFDQGAGILALAATAHPDFDDTPLFDENADGDRTNDGAAWHSHWVVLAGNEACGEGALAVVDIPEGTTPALPATWPGLPLLIDSPGYTPVFDGAEVSVTVALPHDAAIIGTAYDGVTSALKVHANLHAPLLCVTDVFDVASGDLSLPGVIE